jgi:alkylation response protein AidB-like acyl-CoA dehydrogenase
MTYVAPVAEQRFLLKHVVRMDELSGHNSFADATPDLVDAILEGAGAFAAGEFAPLNRVGDQVGAKWSPEGVTMPEGFRQAYQSYVEGGWGTIAGPAEYGGQGLPLTLAAVVMEDLGSANMAFSLIMMLSPGSVESLTHHGSEELKRIWLPKLVTGEWNGTMNLTEPQAGSDVGALKTRAIPNGDGTYSNQRHEDLHHLRRARSHRQYRAPGACPASGRTGGHEGHLALPRAQVPARTGRRAR